MFASPSFYVFSNHQEFIIIMIMIIIACFSRVLTRGFSLKSKWQ